MENVSQAIRERRTIRKFSARPVEQEVIVALLNEAASLYEAEGTPHWRCLYFGTPESREELAESMIAKVKDSHLGKLLPARMTGFLKNKSLLLPPTSFSSLNPPKRSGSATKITPPSAALCRMFNCWAGNKG